jgi:hypothetical protein
MILRLYSNILSRKTMLHDGILFHQKAMESYSWARSTCFSGPCFSSGSWVNGRILSIVESSYWIN